MFLRADQVHGLHFTIPRFCAVRWWTTFLSASRVFVPDPHAEHVCCSAVASSTKYFSVAAYLKPFVNKICTPGNL